jgi:hypothetical protein
LSSNQVKIGQRYHLFANKAITWRITAPHPTDFKRWLMIAEESGAPGQDVEENYLNPKIYQLIDEKPEKKYYSRIQLIIQDG